jgi:hypothetical protein
VPRLRREWNETPVARPREIASARGGGTWSGVARPDRDRLSGTIAMTAIAGLHDLVTALAFAVLACARRPCLSGRAGRRVEQDALELQEVCGSSCSWRTGRTSPWTSRMFAPGTGGSVLCVKTQHGVHRKCSTRLYLRVKVFAGFRGERVVPDGRRFRW